MVIRSSGSKELLQIPRSWVWDVPWPIEHCEHCDVGLLHSRKTLEELGRDQKVLRGVRPNRVLDDTSEHDPLVSLIHSLVDLVHHSEWRRSLEPGASSS